MAFRTIFLKYIYFMYEYEILEDYISKCSMKQSTKIHVSMVVPLNLDSEEGLYLLAGGLSMHTWDKETTRWAFRSLLNHRLSHRSAARYGAEYGLKIKIKKKGKANSGPLSCRRPPVTSFPPSNHNYRPVPTPPHKTPRTRIEEHTLTLPPPVTPLPHYHWSVGGSSIHPSILPPSIIVWSLVWVTRSESAQHLVVDFEGDFPFVQALRHIVPVVFEGGKFACGGGGG